MVPFNTTLLCKPTNKPLVHYLCRLTCISHTQCYVLQPDAPPKKYKTEKKSKGEKAMKAITAFKKNQSEADKRFQKAEEVLGETEMEEKRRKDEHDMRPFRC